MKNLCIGCGERPPIPPSAVCDECRAELQAEIDAASSPPIKDCEREHPWPGCRCTACAKALDKRFRDVAAVHAKLAAKGRKIVIPELDPTTRRRNKRGPARIEIIVPRYELEAIEMAATLSTLPRRRWARRALRRQAWLETHGEAALVTRMDDLTRAVSLLLQKVEELSARPPSDPRPRRR